MSQFFKKLNITMDSQNDLEGLIDTQKFEFRTEKQAYSFGELSNMYKEKELIIKPEYQRFFRWDNEKKSKFIESIIVGIPYPNAFVNLREDGVYELIDGLQRVSTVLSFMGMLDIDLNNSVKKEGADIFDAEVLDEDNEINIKKDWKLEGCTIIKELNGKSYSDLPQSLQIKIKRSSIWFEVLSAKNLDLKYKLFDRLNTGGSPATPQEVRNAIYRGEKGSVKFFSVLEECSNYPKFLTILNFDEDKIKKLFHHELVLRFFALYENNQRLQGNLKEVLDTYISECVKTDRDFAELSILFKDIIDLLSNKSLNFKWHRNYKEKQQEMSFSSSYFDAIMVGIATNIDFYKSNDILVRDKVMALKKDENFKKSAMGSFASNEDRIKKRIEQAIVFFSNHD